MRASCIETPCARTYILRAGRIRTMETGPRKSLLIYRGGKCSVRELPLRRQETNYQIVKTYLVIKCETERSKVFVFFRRRGQAQTRQVCHWKCRSVDIMMFCSSDLSRPRARRVDLQCLRTTLRSSRGKTPRLRGEGGRCGLRQTSLLTGQTPSA